ncbi:MAG TPA: hypothetical protein VF635_18170, partial [Propionibacteriaceae bacterium]
MSATTTTQSASTPVVEQLDRGATFHVAGHRGLVGSAIWRHLESQGFTDLLGRSSADLDLRARDQVFD